MKVTEHDKISSLCEKRSYPYFARHAATNTIVLVSKYCAVVVRSDILVDGDAWSGGKDFDENWFQPLPKGFTLTLENE